MTVFVNSRITALFIINFGQICLSQLNVFLYIFIAPWASFSLVLLLVNSLKKATVENLVAWKSNAYMISTYLSTLIWNVIFWESRHL